MASDLNIICIVLITIFIPPLGVLIIDGCHANFLINICLTILGYFPGHIHAFWLEYKYYHNKKAAANQEQYAQQQPAEYTQNPYAQQQAYGQPQQYGTVPVGQQEQYGTVPVGAPAAGSYDKK